MRLALLRSVSDGDDGDGPVTFRHFVHNLTAVGTARPPGIEAQGLRVQHEIGARISQSFVQFSRVLPLTQIRGHDEEITHTFGTYQFEDGAERSCVFGS